MPRGIVTRVRDSPRTSQTNSHSMTAVKQNNNKGSSTTASNIDATKKSASKSRDDVMRNDYPQLRREDEKSALGTGPRVAFSNQKATASMIHNKTKSHYSAAANTAIVGGEKEKHIFSTAGAPVNKNDDNDDTKNMQKQKVKIVGFNINDNSEEERSADHHSSPPSTKPTTSKIRYHHTVGGQEKVEGGMGVNDDSQQLPPGLRPSSDQQSDDNDEDDYITFVDFDTDHNHNDLTSNNILPTGGSGVSYEENESESDDDDEFGKYITSVFYSILSLGGIVKRRKNLIALSEFPIYLESFLG